LIISIPTAPVAPTTATCGLSFIKGPEYNDHSPIKSIYSGLGIKEERLRGALESEGYRSEFRNVKLKEQDH
jgi:hypothetical protein